MTRDDKQNSLDPVEQLLAPSGEMTLLSTEESATRRADLLAKLTPTDTSTITFDTLFGLTPIHPDTGEQVNPDGGMDIYTPTNVLIPIPIPIPIPISIFRGVDEALAWVNGENVQVNVTRIENWCDEDEP